MGCLTNAVSDTVPAHRLLKQMKERAMFIAGYVIGGLLVVGGILGCIAITQAASDPNADIIYAILFVGGCLILLISRIGDRVSGYIRRQEDERAD